MKLIDVDVDVAERRIHAKVELEPIASGCYETALGRALAEQPGNLEYVIETPRGISIRVAIEADDFPSLIEKAQAEQECFSQRIGEAKRLRDMLYAIEKAKQYLSSGLRKEARDF